MSYIPFIEQSNSLERTMNSVKKIITRAAVAIMIGGTMAAPPAAAWG